MYIIKGLDKLLYGYYNNEILIDEFIQHLSNLDKKEVIVN